MSKKMLLREKENRTITLLTHHTATRNEIECLQSKAFVKEFPQLVKRRIQELQEIVEKEKSKLYPDLDTINRFEAKVECQTRLLERYYRNNGIER